MVFRNPWALSSALAVLGSLQPRALRFLNTVDPLVSVSNLYVESPTTQVSWYQVLSGDQVIDISCRKGCLHGGMHQVWTDGISAPILVLHDPLPIEKFSFVGLSILNLSALLPTQRVAYDFDLAMCFRIIQQYLSNTIYALIPLCVTLEW